MSILHGRNSEQGGAFQLLGVGSPLLDILVQVDDAFLGTIPGEKGGMVMVDAEFQRSVLDRLPVEPRLVPGGSTGNTVFGLARLGVPAAMLGKLGSCATSAAPTRRSSPQPRCRPAPASR